MDEHNKENRFECGLSGIYELLATKITSTLNYKKHLQKMQIQNNRSDENHPHVKSMAHEEENCHPWE
jgi:hypothetical protein